MKDEDRPLVCICIPNYNNEKTIAETLDSLLNQTYQNMIIKIFDNASTDDSMKILREYEAKYPHIQVFQNEINIGGEANFTKCIEGMEGEYSAIYHADDVYMPTIVEEEVKALQNNENLVAVSVNAYKIDENSNYEGDLYKLPNEMLQSELYIFKSQIELLKTTLMYGNLIICPSVMGKTTIYQEKIKEWNGTVYKTSADLDVWLRFSEFGEFGYITTKPLMSYRVSTSSYSYNLARVRTNRHDFFLVVDEYFNKYKYRLEKVYRKYYKFQNFKDNINTSINLIVQNKPIKEIELLDKDILFLCMKKKRILKLYIVGIITKFLGFFYKSAFIGKILYRIRFN